MIVFCGYANRDVTVRVPELPGVGARVQATEVTERDGGMGANAAVAAARVGGHVRFAGVVGADARGEDFLNELALDGVDVLLTTRAGRMTTAIVLLTPDGERAIISQDDELTIDKIAEVHAVSGADWLYLDGYRFPAAHAALRDRPGPRVLVDLDGCAGVVAARAALSLASHAVIGRALAERLIGGEDAVADAAHDHRVHLVVTDGPRGWTLYEPTDGRSNGGAGRHSGAALPVTAVDTTGAGDCFAGVYLAELDRGAEPLAAARFASAAAGLSCTRPGARDGLPDRASVLAALHQSTEEQPCPER
ncbi:carbohydrate kinase family protein [Pseudonocardia acaciae]|uniref:carbohydrate kinase family protein n=1 Tax=Pseudonocardia acaciae TaxID=551276 RepID=UPI000684CCEF|nr:carbohydrate kinase family protein [Pseudonocardia acaciae]